jgi:hypothetical protein
VYCKSLIWVDESVALKASAAFTIFSISVSTDHEVHEVVEPAAETLKFNEHDCPPKVIAKMAVPEAEGVPVIAKIALPAPEAKVAAVKVAVSPVTPEDAIADPAEYTAPLPPM